MKILVLNAGSNSLKFELVIPTAGDFGRKLMDGVFDDIARPEATFALYENKRKTHEERRTIRDYADAANQLFDWLETTHPAIDRIGHRVVHGADLFSAPSQITPEVIHQIESLEDLAPLHNASALAVIRVACKRAQGIPMFAVFDTVFHCGIPDYAATYALPLEVSKRNKIRRYGFHGISHRYLMLRYCQLTGRTPEKCKLITLHLEGGSSAAAIRFGKSVDTSMGFTPLEGLVMGTRTGDLDPALVLYLMRKEGLDEDGVEELLNKKSGLLGLSGRSEDTRVLVQHLDDARTVLALEVFSYRVRKYIGAYLTALEGAEALVFGGGISENTPLLRERICAGLEWCGLVLDPVRNSTVIDCEGPITTPDSRLQAWVIPAEEGLMIAREIADLAT